MSTGDALHRVLSREIETLRTQLRGYRDEAMIWDLPAAGLSNSAGTLTLHLAGNLQHFIGAVLGGTGYVRDREREFAARGLTRDELFAELTAADAALASGLAGLTEDRLDTPYPLDFGGCVLPTRTILVRLVAHFGYHLGQIDIHRRLVTGDRKAMEEPPLSLLAG